MIPVLHRTIEHDSRSDVFNIVPLGDVHIGNAACDEGLLQSVVDGILATGAYWIGLGDYAEFINIRDPRFEPEILAPWITTADLVDLARAQSERFIDIVRPIAPQCLGLVEGNHERGIKKYFERDIYSAITANIKQMGKFPADYKMQFGYYGWLLLSFLRGSVARTMVTINLHHGFGGGRLKGGKALNMERWLNTHNCDLAIFGHCHNADATRVGVDYIGDDGEEHTQTRKGVYSGTFMANASYAVRQGYLPLPLGGVEIVLTPGAMRREDVVRIVT